MFRLAHIARRPAFSGALKAVFLAAVLLRALIPVGYMVNQSASAHGGSLLMLCPTGLSEHTVHLLGLHHEGHERSPAPDHLEAPCTFAAVAALPGALDAPYTLDAPTGLMLRAAVSHPLTPHTINAADAWQARAPPHADSDRSAI